MSRTLLGLGAIALTLAACERAPGPGSGFSHDQAAAPDPSAAPGATAAPPAPTAPTAADGISGTVVETMNAAGYTYARLDRDGTELWVAGPETQLAVGARVTGTDGQLMTGFRSESLSRTFDQIYFVNGFTVTGGAAATPPPATAADDLSGTVGETMDAGGYTYARIDRTGAPAVWVAGPQSKLAVGTQLGRMKGTLMAGFHSDTLGRTFDQIYFITAFRTPDGHPVPGSVTPGATAAATPAAGSGAAAVGTIARAPGGKTVAEIYAGKADLAQKTVAVRGKVVKVNNGILGSNWIHLRDGTGTGTASDLLVTSQGTAQVGDVVVARGTVAVDRDLGAGYKYAVLVENATIATE